ncbi:UNVERIFIED_CONTAM: Conserved oligomeric Golgi complex subunit [Siphonaria sp. JEL0065]|nr:Conserved oligomeric Golgi complex subunit [Siphonaria sp. JEL0065]
MANQLQSQYPLPPSYYSRFTDEALALGTDPLLKPPPPLGPGVAAYTVFGDNLRLTDRPPLLSEMGLTQLFPNEYSPGFDRAKELKKLNHSLLLNFLELQLVLTKRPEQYVAKIEDIRLIYINIHYLLNGYRPHQARDTLKLLMELQIKRRLNIAKDIEACLKDVDNVFGELRQRISEVAGGLGRVNENDDNICNSISNINGDSSMDMDVDDGGQYKDFLDEDFDAAQYANRIIQAPEGKTYHRTDISTALSKLNFSIDHLNKELHDQVAAHYEDLLEQVTGLDDLEQTLETIKEAISAANSSFDRVKTKIRDIYTQIEDETDQLELMQGGTELLRQVQKFLNLMRRLEGHLKEGDKNSGVAKAAICVKEIETLLEETDLTGIDVVDAETGKVAAAKATILLEGEKLLLDGLKGQNQADIASGLQVFYNIGLVSQKTKTLVDNSLDIIAKETQFALNVQTLSKEIKEQHSQTGKGAEPVNVTSPHYTVNLWKRLEALMDIVYENTVKVYLLERVLSRKKDPLSQVSYIDQVSGSMEGNLIKYYWKIISLNFEKEIRGAVKSSSFFHQIFQVGYPKLLRLFHDLFSRLTVTNVSGTNASGVTAQSPTSTQNPFSGDDSINSGKFAAESSVLLKALSSFETAYLRESLARLLEPVNQAFPENAGNRKVATRDDVDKLLRAISRELEISKFDPHLLKSVSKNATKAINMYHIRSEHSSANPSQLLNIDIVNCLWILADGVGKLMDEFDDDTVVGVLTDSVEGVQKFIQSVVEPLIAGLTRDIELTIIKIHREDFNRSAAGTDQSLSQYIIEVGGKLRWIQREIMARFQCGDDTKEWYKAVGTRVIDFFLRQASLIRPLNTEQGKLKLTTDMTQLEFNLNQWIAPTGVKLEAAMGASYKALRAFRQLLFLDLNQVTAMHHTADIPLALVAHHLIVRAHPLIHLPITAFGMTEIAYSDWLDVHTEAETVALLGQCLAMYMDDVRRQGGREYRVEFVAVRNLLKLV